jgi:DNA-directed RNA polymerase sigma subunit (sigma70/sigma32)
MDRITKSVSRRMCRDTLLPSHVFHPDFLKRNAPAVYRAEDALNEARDYDSTYMPDEVTKNFSRRMHYAAHRMHTARTATDATKWQAVYHTLRDQIVLGNRKLIFRAVRRRLSMPHYAEDFVGDCHIVLIQAVAAFNPWLGIRFSTYAYTCLVRALSRLSQRMSADGNVRALALDSLPDGEPRGKSGPPMSGPLFLDEYLRDDHPLLTAREKSIISRRFSLKDDSDGQTLERVGKAMGLSKERVRQVQSSALQKLRIALSPADTAA